MTKYQSEKTRELEKVLAEKKARAEELELEKKNLESAFYKLLANKRTLTEAEASAVISELDGNLSDAAIYEFAYQAEREYREAKENLVNHVKEIKKVETNSRSIKINDNMTDKEILELARQTQTKEN